MNTFRDENNIKSMAISLNTAISLKLSKK